MNWYKTSQEQMEFDLGEPKVDMSPSDTNVQPIDTEKTDIQSADKREKQKKPYYLAVMKHDVEERKQFKDVWAYSASQARMIFFNLYPFLETFLQLGYDVEAIFDRNLFEKFQQQKEQSRISEMQKKEREEQFLQEDAWWNK